ncbi:uncharacterized protein HGUI_04004 [Hanseniaspora guilliermondii]|uniref:Uncharacterized protein n=1 Tax=Hanseniaspora guilliermondii TaxID=56406 RepID=A0A1L0B9H2_9ASCO|nr:uncharacterized protein HGUI_04004 [Hanseniaspora guilliermondii]
MSQVIRQPTATLSNNPSHVEISSIEGYKSFIKKQESIGNNILTRVSNDKTHIEVIDESGATIAIVMDDAMKYLLSCI